MAAFAIALDTATPLFRRMAGRIQGQGRERRFLMRWGARVRRMAIANCLAKGGRRFWREMARSINIEEEAGAVRVQASHVAAAQKQYGGRIRAKGKAAGGAEYLAIPVEGSGVENVPARRFVMSYGLENVRFAINRATRKGVLGLPREGDEIDVKYALVKETEPQKPEPFFPSSGEVTDVGADEALILLSR